MAQIQLLNFLEGIALGFCLWGTLESITHCVTGIICIWILFCAILYHLLLDPLVELTSMDIYI